MDHLIALLNNAFCIKHGLVPASADEMLIEYLGTENPDPAIVSWLEAYIVLWDCTSDLGL
ncbi:hypothetical protein pEaSNUABM44_00008 [Erwinia phage pEa_SNUABM_44]|nr:hypothetical protein pEaSNUABM44_00008 [Erwinia phage pEa_SNUABM_44]